ncbi:MAG: hypothetical protein PHS86_00235 [Syntrophaceae bacterium]|nr:hypothetical protein [Syntrophaceae bacterium]
MDNELRSGAETKPAVNEHQTNSEYDPRDLPTPFKYKALAALILIVPFGFFIDGGQTFFLAMDWEYVSKMTVLIGLILYIVAVGKLAARIRDWKEQ